MDSHGDWVLRALREAVDEWLELQAQEPDAVFYVFWKPGSIKIATERPGGYELASPGRVRPDWANEYTYLMRRMYEMVEHLPRMTERDAVSGKGKEE